MAGFLTVLLFFLEQLKRSGRKQTTALSSKINKKIRANFGSLPKPLPRESSPPQTDFWQKTKQTLRLAASDDKIAHISIPY